MGAEGVVVLVGEAGTAMAEAVTRGIWAKMAGRQRGGRSEVRAKLYSKTTAARSNSGHDKTVAMGWGR
jgi:hypothetical protein